MSVFAGIAAQGCTITTSDGPIDFDSGVKPTPTTDAGGNTQDTGTTTGDPCNECLFDRCTAQWTLCQQNTSCAQTYACATQPGQTSQGVVTCFCNAASDGQRRYDGLATCDAVEACGACATQCASAGFTCPAPAFPSAQELGCPNAPDAGQVADGGTEDASGQVTTCQACSSSQCATEEGACASGSECDKYSQCVAACQDANCINTCNTQRAAGAQASAALATCVASKCATACGL